MPICVGQFGGGAAIAEPLAAKIATAEQAVSSADVDFPPRNFIVSRAPICRLFVVCKKQISWINDEIQPLMVDFRVASTDVV